MTNQYECLKCGEELMYSPYGRQICTRHKDDDWYDEGYEFDDIEEI